MTRALIILGVLTGALVLVLLGHLVVWRLIPPLAVAEAVWSAYSTDKIHWYVPPELHDFDTQATAAPELLRDAMAAGGGVLGGDPAGAT